MNTIRIGLTRVARLSVATLWLVSFAAISSAEDVDTAWVRIYNGPANKNDVAYDVVADGSNNVYVTGSSTASGHAFLDDDVLTIKYSPAGDTVWLRRFNSIGDNSELGRLIVLTNDGHFIIAGTSNAANPQVDFFIMKYTVDGDTVWTRWYNGSGDGADSPVAMVLDGNGRILVTGNTWNGTDLDYLTVCYDTDGTLDWFHEYDDAGLVDNAVDIDVDTSGNAYVTGYGDAAGNQDIVTIKYDVDGNVVWNRRYNGTNNLNDQGRALAVDAEQNIVVAGFTSTATAVGDFVTIKYNPDGDTLWVRQYDGPANGADNLKVLAVDASQNVFVAGDMTTGLSITKLGMIGYAPDGDTLWTRFHSPYVNARDIATDVSGNLFVTGDGAKPGGFFTDWGTYKFTPSGDTAWFRWLFGPILPSWFQNPNGIAVDGLGGVIVAGMTYGAEQDYGTVKYIPACLCPYQSDFDQDGFLTALDLGNVIDILFAGQTDIQDASCPNPRADFDCDSFSTALDLGGLIDHLFAGGSGPCNPCSP